MPLNLGGFNPGIPGQGSELSQWLEGARQTGGQYTKGLSDLISAFNQTPDPATGQINIDGVSMDKTAAIQYRQVKFEQAKQMFELFQNMFKSASETVMSLIRRLDPR
jgi:ABC-type polar amino acid transport system ATPase subunit